VVVAGRRTNLALLAAIAAAFATGVLAFGLGTPRGRVAVVAHGVAGLVLVLLAPWKSLIVRRSLARRRHGTGGSLLFLALVLVALAAGILHSTGLARTLGPLTAMQVHVGAALACVPLALSHVAARRVRVHSTDVARRQLLKAGAVVGASGVVYGALEVGVRVLSLPGASRRATGSYETGSLQPARMPVTQWLNDRVPDIDRGAWRLRVETALERRVLAYDDLSAYRHRRRAVVDCTGGWWAEQDWEGVWLATLLGPVEGRSINVSSVTGYGRRFPLGDASSLLLATRVGGAPLSAGHGAPLRLVAPGRRGFWWVKWVSAIAVDDRPWWWQSPFPLT
jgi:hypothetical protein